jgi:hypothetical protein
VAGRSALLVRPGWQGAGRHEISLSLGDLATGVYLLRLRAGALAATAKITRP